MQAATAPGKLVVHDKRVELPKSTPLAQHKYDSSLGKHLLHSTVNIGFVQSSDLYVTLLQLQTENVQSIFVEKALMQLAQGVNHYAKDGGSLLELRLRTVSAALVALRVTCTHITRNLQAELAQSIKNLDKFCDRHADMDVEAARNPNIAFLMRRIKRDTFAMKNDTTKLEMAGQIALCLSAAALKLYGRDLVGAVCLLSGSSLEWNQLWDGFSTTAMQLNTIATSGRASNADDILERSLTNAAQNVQPSKYKNKAIEMFLGRETALLWDTLDAFQEAFRQENDPVLAREACQVALKLLSPTTSKELNFKAMELLTVIEATSGIAAVEALAQSQQTFQRAQKLGQWDRLREQVIDKFQRDVRLRETIQDEIDRDVFFHKLEGSAPVVNPLLCPISGVVMADAVQLGCSHTVSETALREVTRAGPLASFLGGKGHFTPCCPQVHVLGPNIAVREAAQSMLLAKGDVNTLALIGKLSVFRQVLQTVDVGKVGDEALYWACANGKLDIVKELMDVHFVRPGSHRDAMGRTAIDVATSTVRPFLRLRAVELPAPNNPVVNLSDGGTFEGRVIRGYFEGPGIWQRPSGERRAGDFAHGVLEGPGAVVYVNGDFRQGTFKGGRHRTGLLVRADKTRHIGLFGDDGKLREGRIEGPGTEFMEGRFIDDRLQGQGIYTFSNGDKRRGHFDNGFLNGLGDVEYGNGDVRHGNFIGGRHRQGVLIHPDGRRFEGSFGDDGKLMGRGKLTMDDRVFTGSFMAGLLEGLGRISFADGTEGVATFVHGEPQDLRRWTPVIESPASPYLTHQASLQQ